MRIRLGLGENHIIVPSEEEIENATAPYLTELGRVVYAWNRMHEKLSQLFCVVAGYSDPDIGSEMWHRTRSDLAQRDMLRAAADITNAKAGGKDPKMLDIIWALDKIDKNLAYRRNEAIHATYELVQDLTGKPVLTFESDRWSGNQKSKELADKDLFDEFTWRSAYANTLAQYIEEMELHLNDGDADPGDLYDEDGNELYPWPERPLLPQKEDKKSG